MGVSEHAASNPFYGLTLVCPAHVEPRWGGNNTGMTKEADV